MYGRYKNMQTEIDKQIARFLYRYDKDEQIDKQIDKYIDR